MLSFLSSLFGSDERPADAVERSQVEAAIERIVDATDPRLRAFPGYRKRLYAGVEKSLSHVRGLVDALPQPVEISRRTFGADPRLRAFFSSPARMQEAIGKAPSVVDFMANYKGPYPDHIYGLLAAEKNERRTLGMELNGSQVRRDVMQEVVDFANFRFLGASATEADARHEIKRRGFDYLAGLALKHVLERKESKRELESQRRLLQRKLDAMQAGNWGLEPILTKAETAHPDYLGLEEKIQAVEAELMAMPCSQSGLDQRFDCINHILEQPDDGLSLRQIELHLDAMSVKVDQPAEDSAEPIRLLEFFSSSGDRRVALFGHFPRAELPPERDFFAEAGRYLG